MSQLLETRVLSRILQDRICKKVPLKIYCRGFWVAKTEFLYFSNNDQTGLGIEPFSANRGVVRDNHDFLKKVPLIIYYRGFWVAKTVRCKELKYFPNNYQTGWVIVFRDLQ